MAHRKQKTFLLVGADAALGRAVASAAGNGDAVHNFADPFLIPAPGSGLANLKKELHATKTLGQFVAEIGSIDVLVNCLSLDAHNGGPDQPDFAGVYASAIMQLSRGMSAVLPGMIIRQRGKIVTLVAARRKTVHKTTHRAAIMAAASITGRIGAAMERDNIQSKVMLHRGSLAEDPVHALAENIVDLASSGNSRICCLGGRVGEHLLETGEAPHSTPLH